ncbi:NYN domain-containing protein [Sulfurimonas sp. MAG313]|nr:NYN domain-containing protein [Sulfurimonas sp. MAG313]MDF1881873.1 NYN domain-containing protein [Sulfurimonas sp. MAG313]
MIKEQKSLAVIIDADNSQPSIIEGLMEEIAQYGVASVKRIYGDWTDTRLKGWKSHLLSHAIAPMQQFGYTVGKNSTDSAMIIDAMDLLYTGKLDGFCIVSSDSDFTRLAQRIREAGLSVYGFGEKKTPKAFLAACDKFIYTENLRKVKKSSPAKIPVKVDISKDKALQVLLKNVVEDTADHSGWSYLTHISQTLANRHPDFDPRNYGFSKMMDLIIAVDMFEIKKNDPFSHNKAVFLRCKRQKRNY